MSPSRTPYRSPRRRREVFLAVLGVVAVLAFTGVMLWVLAPSDDTVPVPPIATTLPPDTSAPAGSTTSSSAPG